MVIKKNKHTDKELLFISSAIRKKTIESIHSAGSGHCGGSLSIADIMTVLWFNTMNHNLSKEKNDKFILSKGHAAPVLYATLCELNLISNEELLSLRQVGSRLQGHPDRTKLDLLDAGTGALGQGLSIAIGYAIAGKISKTNNKVYCIVGDGELQEGQIWEAAMYAGSNLGKELICIVDCNRLQNETWVEETLPMGNIQKKWESFGWNTNVINGHDMSEIQNALNGDKYAKDAPIAIIANTIKGKGISFMENNNVWHGKALDDQSFKMAINELNNLK